MKTWMRPVAVFLIAASCLSCTVHKLESAKVRYEQARTAQEQGKDLEAILHWKELVKVATQELERGHIPSTNYFLRATAQFELGNWDQGFDDLKQLQPQSLSKEEFWIYPLYLILMGDYYGERKLPAVADNFYQAVLKKSSLKSSPVFLLALERHVNNKIRMIDVHSKNESDAAKYIDKEYETLAKEIEKYIEDYPFSSVSHFLLADLLLKADQAETSLQHFLAALEMGLPTRDLQRGAEFQIASLLSEHQVSNPLKSALLSRAVLWWGKNNESSVLTAGEATMEWLRQRSPMEQVTAENGVRYLAVRSGDQLKILVWEAK